MNKVLQRFDITIQHPLWLTLGGIQYEIRVQVKFFKLEHIEILIRQTQNYILRCQKIEKANI